MRKEKEPGKTEKPLIDEEQNELHEKGIEKSTIYLLIIFSLTFFILGNATGFFLLKSAKETVYVDSNLYSYSSDVENSSAEAFGGVSSDGERLYPIQFQRKIPKRIPPKTQPLNPTRRIIRRLLSKPSLLLTEFTSISLRRARNITILRPAAEQTPIKPLLTKLCRRARRPVRNVSNSKSA